MIRIPSFHLDDVVYEQPLSMHARKRENKNQPSQFGLSFPRPKHNLSYPLTNQNNQRL